MRMEGWAEAMRMTKEELSIRVVVRRRNGGATPFAWEIWQTDMFHPIHISEERFRGMDAAFQAGQARLKEFIPERITELEPEFAAA
jgi:hypothetical protein